MLVALEPLRRSGLWDLVAILVLAKQTNFPSGETTVARWIPLIVGLPLIGISTYLQGSWTHRWSNQPDKAMQGLVDRYESIPKRVGDQWIGEDTPYSKEELQAAGAHAHLSRSYRNSETGERVSVFMICGYARDVTVHTPEFCYVGAGFEVESPPSTFAIESPEGSAAAELSTSTFLKERPNATIHQRILWGWTAGERWNTPDYPRWKYPGKSVLNKVYLISNIEAGSSDELAQDHPVVRFGREFLPLARETLYPAGTAGNPSPESL